MIIYCPQCGATGEPGKEFLHDDACPVRDLGVSACAVSDGDWAETEGDGTDGEDT